jgi:hypothetical protein
VTKVYAPADLSLIERTYLGVLATGIVPARMAKDQSLRMDFITAVCLAVRENKPRATYLEGEGPEIAPDFRRQLTEAVLALDAKKIISAGTPPSDLLLSADPALSSPPPPRVIDFDQHPRLFDRYLAQQCMEELFSNPDIYPFLMGKYQDSADVWGRLYQQGYGRWR